MRVVSLEQSVREIRQACERAAQWDSRLPFFYIVGAGLSHPPIPLATQIVEHCRAEAARWGGQQESPGRAAPVDVYSHWFGVAYPQAADRQRYLRRLMERSHISRANFRLAHLLLSKSAGNIVVTPNFDDLLSRALALFGRRHIICDHPQTVERIDAESQDVQIVHVHGTYWFYDCANLKHEMDTVSAFSGEESFSMSSLLEDILRSRVPLILGYSGWEGDVIMGALKRRLAKPLPRNIYWFCYRRVDAEMLPEWLRNHPSFVAVVPPQEAVAASSPASELSRNSAAEATLPATVVLDALIREFQLDAPHLTKDPVGFFASQLRESLWVDDGADAEDVYAIRAVVERVERARDAELSLPRTENPGIEAMREALRRSNHREVIVRAQKLDLESLNPLQLRELALSAAAAAESLQDDSSEEIAGYELTVRAAEVLEKGGHADPILIERVARALFNLGVTLSTLGRKGEAAKAYEAVGLRLAKAPEPKLRELAANASLNRAMVVAEERGPEEAIPLYDEFIKEFSDASESVIQLRVAMALLNRGYSLGVVGRSEEALEAYSELIGRFGESSQLSIQDQVAKALINKGIRLGLVGRLEEALAAYDELVHRFGSTSAVELHEPVARALVLKGNALTSLGRAQDAIATYDEVLSRFGSAKEPKLAEWVARALSQKATALSPEGDDEAIPIWSEIIRRFGDSSDGGVTPYVARALVSKGIRLATGGRHEEGIKLFDEVVRRFGEADERTLRAAVATALVSKALAQSSDEQLEPALRTYADALKRIAGAADQDLDELASRALEGAVYVQDVLGRDAEASVVFDRVLHQLSDASGGSLQQLLAKAVAPRNGRHGLAPAESAAEGKAHGVSSSDSKPRVVQARATRKRKKRS